MSSTPRWRTGALKTVFTLGTAVLLVAALLPGAASAQRPDATTPVREQNLDSGGAIRVHETGVASVNVTNDSVPVTVGNFPATQQVAGTVDIGNLPATQNVNIVGGTVQTSTAVVNAVFNTPLLQLDEATSHRITLDPPIYATAVTVKAPENEESVFRFRAWIPGPGGAQCASTPTNCTVLLMEDVGGTVTQVLPFPMPIDRIEVFCHKAGAFLNQCMPEIIVAGLRL